MSTATRPAPSTVTQMRVRSGRTLELILLVVAVGIVVLAYVNVNLAAEGALPAASLCEGDQWDLRGEWELRAYRKGPYSELANLAE